MEATGQSVAAQALCQKLSLSQPEPMVMDVTGSLNSNPENRILSLRDLVRFASNMQGCTLEEFVALLGYPKIMLGCPADMDKQSRACYAMMRCLLASRIPITLGRLLDACYAGGLEGDVIRLVDMASEKKPETSGTKPNTVIPPAIRRLQTMASSGDVFFDSSQPCHSAQKG